MNKDSLINNQWVDIINPAPPESDALFWWLVTISILLAVSLILQFIWKRRPRQILIRQIKWLVNTTSIKPKQRLRMLEQSICQYFKITQLSQVPITHPHWTSYVSRLQRACYQARIIKHEHARKLLKQASTILMEHS